MLHVSMHSLELKNIQGLINGLEKKEEYSEKGNFKGEGGIKASKTRLYTNYLNENISLCRQK